LTSIRICPEKKQVDVVLPIASGNPELPGVETEVPA
jgi:hypothetical protein